jgi:hypothetical protein
MKGLHAAFAALVLGALPVPALATCSTIPVRDTLPPGASAIDQRYAELIAADRFTDAAGQAERWKTLIAEAEAGKALDPARLARAHTWYGYALEYADKADQALAPAREALKIVESNGLAGTDLHVEVLAVLSMLEIDGGDFRRGQELAERALALVKRLHPGDSAEQSLVQNALGNAAYAQGRYVEAEQGFGLASAMAEKCLPPDNAFIINQMASHAGTLYMVGRTEDALVENQRAARWALTHLPESNPTITLALGNLGTLLETTGRLAEAEATMRKVVDLEARYQSESWLYRAISLSNYAAIINLRGRHEEAEAYWLKSLEFHRKSTIKRDPTTPAYPLRYAADAAQARGDLELALERRRQAVAIMTEATPPVPPDNTELARARLEEAMTLLRMGKARQALAQAQGPIELLRAKLGENDTKRMTAEIGFARLLAANGDREGGYALARAVAGRLEKKLLDVSTRRSELVRYGPAFSDSFSAVTVLALETGRHDEAFRFLQLANLSDIVLVSSEVAARAAASDASSGARIRAFQDLLQQRQVLDRNRSFALSKGNAEEVARIVAAIEQADAQIAEAGAALDRDFPDYARLGRPQPLPLSEYRKRLQPGQALLAPLLVEQASYTIVVSPEGLNWSRSNRPRFAVQADLRDLRASIETARTGTNDSPAFDFAASRRLAGTIFTGAAGKLARSARELLYHATGPLAALPPSLLIVSDRGLTSARKAPQKADWLVRHQAVTVVPSLIAPPRRAGTAGKAFLGVGAPELGAKPATRSELEDQLGQIRLSDLPPLPSAEGELRRMAMTLPGRESRILVGRDASETALRGMPLRDYGVIAFATHGLVGGEIAGLTEPALVLTPDGQASDGLLTASEVMALQLDADWVILSACNTASGDSPGGPSYAGLASAFTHAGARALLVSHWPVRDDVAARLTARTLALHATGITRAEALRRAMVETLDDPAAHAADPAAWAPFVLIEP